MDKVSSWCYFLCGLLQIATVKIDLIIATVMETPISEFLKWLQTGELQNYKKNNKTQHWVMNAYISAQQTPHRQRCLLFIVGVKTITQINIEYACISEGIEENKCSKMSF